MNACPGRQRGMTLLVGLIMLVLMTLFAVTTFNLGKSSLQIVGNMQQRNAAALAAQSTIEEAISTTRFFQRPDAVFFATATCRGPNTRCYDVNGDGTPDVTVRLDPQPLCLSARTIPNASLNLSDANDAGCSMGVSQSFGIQGAATGDSLCANSLWQITASASDAVTQAQATVVQGLTVRVSTDDVATSCPF